MTTATMNAQAQSGAKGLDAGKNAEAKVNWKCPTQSNVITSPFGPRNVKGGSNPHKGIDLRAQAGASYYAAADGKVTRAGGGDYNTIVIDHGGGIQTRYLHASSVSAKVGNVKAGDRLAAAGGKGPKGVNHYAYHLHFDVIKNGTYIDPEAFLQSQGVSLVRKGGEGKTENGTTGGKKNNNAAQGGRQMNAEGHPIYYPKGAKETQEIINWNKGRNYTADYIKSFQKVIGTKVDGGIGTDTVNAIRHYQEKNGLGQDGKWGKDCADHAKLERKYNSGSAGNTTNASSGGKAASSGGRKIEYIFVHCTAGHQNQTAQDVKNYHLKSKAKGGRGWSRPGYHYIVEPSGAIVQLVNENQISNGVVGYNSKSINVCYIGGIDKKLNPLDNRTGAQKEGIRNKLLELRGRYPNAKILGHRNVASKACPSFDARTEYKDI